MSKKEEKSTSLLDVLKQQEGLILKLKENQDAMESILEGLREKVLLLERRTPSNIVFKVTNKD